MFISTNEKSEIKYSRVLFKISGEALMGSNQFGHDMETIGQLSKGIVSRMILANVAESSC